MTPDVALALDMLAKIRSNPYRYARFECWLDHNNDRIINVTEGQFDLFGNRQIPLVTYKFYIFKGEGRYIASPWP